MLVDITVCHKSHDEFVRVLEPGKVMWNAGWLCPLITGPYKGLNLQAS